MNSQWMLKWPNSFQKGLKRSVSDHCPILLEVKVRDWGPKPFRSINAWHTHPSFKEFVCNKWQSYRVLGWGSYVLKENFKLLKNDLKLWNKQTFGVLEDNIEKH